MHDVNVARCDSSEAGDGVIGPDCGRQKHDGGAKELYEVGMLVGLPLSMGEGLADVDAASCTPEAVSSLQE